MNSLGWERKESRDKGNIVNNITTIHKGRDSGIGECMLDELPRHREDRYKHREF